MINGHCYEAAIEVTPLGQLVPYLNIILPPQREAPVKVKLDDPYDLDVSDEDNEVAKPELESTAHLHFNGHIPDFWGAWDIEGLIGPNVITLFVESCLTIQLHIHWAICFGCLPLQKGL